MLIYRTLIDKRQCLLNIFVKADSWHAMENLICNGVKKSFCLDCTIHEYATQRCLDGAMSGQSETGKRINIAVRSGKNKIYWPGLLPVEKSMICSQRMDVHSILTCDLFACRLLFEQFTVAFFQEQVFILCSYLIYLYQSVSSKFMYKVWSV